MTTKVVIKVEGLHQGKEVLVRMVTPESKDPAVPLTAGHVWETLRLTEGQSAEKYVHAGARMIVDEVDPAGVGQHAGAIVTGDDVVTSVVDGEGKTLEIGERVTKEGEVSEPDTRDADQRSADRRETDQ